MDSEQDVEVQSTGLHDLLTLILWALPVQQPKYRCDFSRLNTKLNSICHLLPLIGAHHILHVS